MSAKALKAEEEVERLMKLLDDGLDHLKRGRGTACVQALAEALEVAQKLPKKTAVG